MDENGMYANGGNGCYTDNKPGVKKPAAMGRSTDPHFAVTISREQADLLAQIVEHRADDYITSKQYDELIEALKS